MDSIGCFPSGPLCGGQIKGRHQKLTCSSFILRKARSSDLWLLLNGKGDAKRRVCDAALLGTLILETTNLLSAPTGIPHCVPDHYSHFASFHDNTVSLIPKQTNQKASKHRPKRWEQEGAAEEWGQFTGQTQPYQSKKMSCNSVTN